MPSVCLLVATCLVLRDHLWALLAVALGCAMLASDRVLAAVGLTVLLLAARAALARAEEEEEEEEGAAVPDTPESSGGEEGEDHEPAKDDDGTGAHKEA